MSEMTETEIRVNATILAERDRLQERETFLLNTNQATEDKRREAVRQLGVARSTIQALQETVYTRDQSIALMHKGVYDRDEMISLMRGQIANSTPGSGRSPTAS